MKTFKEYINEATKKLNEGRPFPNETPEIRARISAIKKLLIISKDMPYKERTKLEDEMHELMSQAMRPKAVNESNDPGVVHRNYNKWNAHANKLGYTKRRTIGNIEYAKNPNDTSDGHSGFWDHSDKEGHLNEDAPANCVGGGQISGANGDPPGSIGMLSQMKRRKRKFLIDKKKIVEFVTKDGHKED